MLADDGNIDEYEVDDFDIPKRNFLSPKCWNITEVDLEESNPAEGAREWIQGCKALRSIRIVHGGGMIPDDAFQPSKTHELLSLQKSTLESLWVDNPDTYMWSDDQWMESFVDFTALNVICASLASLVGVDELNVPVRKLPDVLPSSLETLCVAVDGDDSLNGAIDQLAELAASRNFSKLATIHLEYNQFREPRNAMRLEWLEQRRQEASVLFFSS
ncbi:hypothetical protein N7463_007655 [Penicillium fimorum]|uniref:Leucine-rich repeat domain-containing protein n=1 Tax=Penicillium fimorum TaxID=1882269 RepID=A0A9W9XY17_9EURO|nr:hypothetical protein N7463_007655 [Penicillium fimorum]